MVTVDGARRGQGIDPSREWRVHGGVGSISTPLFTVRARANQALQRTRQQRAPVSLGVGRH